MPNVIKNKKLISIHSRSVELETLLYELPDKHTNEPEIVYGKKELTEYLNRIIDEVSQAVVPEGDAARTADIIRALLGLRAEQLDIMTLAAVGKEFGLTRQRILQIRHKFFTILRCEPYASVLQDYIGG